MNLFMPVAQSQYREEKVNVIYFPLYSDFEIKYLPVHLPEAEAEGITVAKVNNPWSIC